MKKFFYFLLLVAINALIYAKPIQAEDVGVKEKPGNRDECLLVAINCGKDFISLEQKIEKLRKEISKGRAVYSDEELNALREKLNNANKTLEFFKYDGASNLYKLPGE